MADNYTSQPVTAGGTTFASDDISSVQYPRVKLSVGADGVASDAIPIAAALDSTGTGIQAVGIVAQYDDVATVAVTENQFAAPRISSRRALLVEGVASGTVIPVSDGSGSLTVDGTVTATSAGDIAHDAGDSGNPVKIGAKAITTALPTAVSAADRANAISDEYGRVLVGHIAPGMQVHSNKTYTSQQTGTDVIDPGASKKIAVTSVVIGAYGTTAGRIILWFGDNADTTFTQDTDQVLMAVSYAPSSTSKPGTVYALNVPVFCNTADRELHVTSDAAVSFDLTVESYEYA